MFRTYVREAQKTLTLGLPFIANQLLQSSVVLTDSIMAGWHSELTLAAVAQGASLWTMIQLVLIGLSMPMTPMIAKAYAKGNHQQLRTIFQQSLWLSVLLGFLGVGLTLFAPMLMHWVGVDAAIIPLTTRYLHIMAFAMPFFTFYLPIRYFNEGIANPKVIMYITALSIPVNVTGNYVFINGLWGMPAMGAGGIAFSSVMAMLFILLLGVGYMQRATVIRSFALLALFNRPRRDVLARFFHLGMPNAVALLLEGGMFTCIVLLTGRLGVTAAAANQVALSYISTAFMIPLGLSFAITTRVGMASAQDNAEKLRQIGVSGIVVGAFFMLCSVVLITIFGKEIASLYTDNTVVIDSAVGLLALATIFQIPDGIQVCGAGALRGMEETKAPMRYALIGYWLLAVPMGVLFAFYFALGARGLWIGLIIGLSITAFLGTRKFWLLTATTELTRQVELKR